MLATTKYTKAVGLNLFYSVEYDIATNIIFGIKVKHPGKGCELVFSSDLDITTISSYRETFIDKDTLVNFRIVAEEALKAFKREVVK